jgi:hypothetical protein
VMSWRLRHCENDVPGMPSPVTWDFRRIVRGRLRRARPIHQMFPCPAYPVAAASGYAHWWSPCNWDAHQEAVFYELPVSCM